MQIVEMITLISDVPGNKVLTPTAGGPSPLAGARAFLEPCFVGNVQHVKQGGRDSKAFTVATGGPGSSLSCWGHFVPMVALDHQKWLISYLESHSLPVGMHVDVHIHWKGTRFQF